MLGRPIIFSVQIWLIRGESLIFYCSAELIIQPLSSPRITHNIFCPLARSVQADKESEGRQPHIRNCWSKAQCCRPFPASPGSVQAVYRQSVQSSPRETHSVVQGSATRAGVSLASHNYSLDCCSLESSEPVTPISGLRPTKPQSFSENISLWSLTVSLVRSILSPVTFKITIGICRKKYWNISQKSFLSSSPSDL